MRQNLSEHPDDLELELSRTGESDPGTNEHVAACRQCRERLEVLTSLSVAAAGGGEFVDIPDALDSAQIDLAKTQAARVARAARRRRIAGWSAAAASILLIMVSGYYLGVVPPAPGDLPRSPVARDVNGDGRVDILDAFELARWIEAGTADARGWDLNGDAVLDRRDVDLLARSVVSLGDKL